MAFLDETGLAYFWNQILARLNKFVPAESGKGLSSNDYTAEEKEKLAGIEVGANKTIVDSTLSATSTNPVQNKVVNTKFETIQAEVDSKVDSIDGKGLSTEDYTTEEKTKLASIAEGAEANVQADWNEADTSSDAYIVNKPTIPSKTSDLTNDSGFLTSIPDEYVTETELTAKGYLTSYTETDPTVPKWAKQPTKPKYTAAEVGALPDTYTPPNQTAEQVGADPAGTAAGAVSVHNTNNDSHADIRLLIDGLTTRLNALANSTDEDLDQMAELVAYIKSNRSLIDSITTSKVSVADIVDNLTTNVSSKPLSAAQGVVIKTLIDALRNDKLDVAELTNAVNTALAQAKASGEFDGADGKSAYAYAVDGGYTGTEAEFAAKLAQEKFANPNALTFTGAVTGRYDGSEPLTVDVPSGGDNGGAWELVADVTMEKDVQQIDIALSKSCKRVWVAVTPYGSTQNSGKSDFYIYVGDKDYKNMIGNTNRVNIDFSSASMIWNFQSLYAEVSGGVIHEIRGYQTSRAFNNGWATADNYPATSLSELFSSSPFEKIETVRLQMWGVYFGAGTRVVVMGA